MVLCLSAVNVWASDEAGSWISVEFSKGLGSRWNLGVGTELRVYDNFKGIDRWHIKADAAFKACSFLKLYTSYEFHLKLKQNNLNEKEIFPRHRAKFDVVFHGKVAKYLRLSMRERYQFTHTSGVKTTPVVNEHHLLSKFKMDFPVKKWTPYISYEIFNRLDKDFKFDEMRFAAGTVYSITEHHDISLGYLLDMKPDADNHFNKRVHVIQIGYVFKW